MNETNHLFKFLLTIATWRWIGENNVSFGNGKGTEVNLEFVTGNYVIRTGEHIDYIGQTSITRSEIILALQNVPNMIGIEE